MKFPNHRTWLLEISEEYGTTWGHGKYGLYAYRNYGRGDAQFVAVRGSRSLSDLRDAGIFLPSLETLILTTDASI